MVDFTMRVSSFGTVSGCGVSHVASRRTCVQAGAARRPVATLAAAGMRTPERATLYERLGGAPAITAAVDIFYEKVLADARINYFFHDVDMKKQRSHQAAFLKFATGGSSSYGGNSNMGVAHQRLANDLGLQMEHFDVVLELLGASLLDLHISQEEVAEAAAIVETLRPSFQAAIDKAKA